MVRALVAWSALFGIVSFELFGQFHNVIDANADFFATAALELAAFVGLPARRRGDARNPAVRADRRSRPPRGSTARLGRSSGL